MSKTYGGSYQSAMADNELPTHIFDKRKKTIKLAENTMPAETNFRHKPICQNKYFKYIVLGTLYIICIKNIFIWDLTILEIRFIVYCLYKEKTDPFNWSVKTCFFNCIRVKICVGYGCKPLCMLGGVVGVLRGLAIWSLEILYFAFLKVIVCFNSRDLIFFTKNNLLGSKNFLGILSH